MTNSAKWWAISCAVASCVALYFLSPVLTPFFVATVLAYLGDPLVNRLVKFKIPRTLAAIIVFFLIVIIILFLPLLIIPLLGKQLAIFIEKIPAIIQWLEQVLIPWLSYYTGVDVGTLDIGAMKSALTSHWQQAGRVAQTVGVVITQSGIAIVGSTLKFLIVSVVTFYLLRDWDVVILNVKSLFPRAVAATLNRLFKECDEVLSAFFRGQLLVMLALAAIYSLGLWIAGLQIALLVGILAGLLSVVPYLGVVIGVMVSMIAAFMQCHEWIHPVYMLVVFVIGNIIETSILTPWLVGNKIGLHPVAVIFAVLAGGQLFGFMGVLLALPVAAVLMVILRHLQHQYLKSDLYDATSKEKKS